MQRRAAPTAGVSFPGTAPPVLGHAYMLQIGLRTLANTSSSGTGIGVP